MEGFQNYSQIDFKSAISLQEKWKLNFRIRNIRDFLVCPMVQISHASNDAYDFFFSNYFGISLIFFFCFLRCKFNLVI